MEKYDSRMAQRVWERVRSEPETEKSWGHLMMAEAQALGNYTVLQGHFPEMKPLTRDIRQHIACLRGIRFLKEGQRCDPVTVKATDEPQETMLRRCYGLSLRLAGEYDALAADPEFGCVCAQLAETKRRHCKALLSILGNAERLSPRK